MGTRLLLTRESGMSDEQIIVKYLNELIGIIVDQNSSTGFWSSRLDVPYTERTDETMRDALLKCVNCVGSGCQYRKNRECPTDETYCIYRDLIKARLGEDVGIYFSGGQIVIMRHDSLYTSDGKPYVPTIEEGLDFTLTHDSPKKPKYSAETQAGPAAKNPNTPLASQAQLIDNLAVFTGIIEAQANIREITERDFCRASGIF